MIQFCDDHYVSSWLPEITDDAYHADKTAISSGGIRSALKSPRHFYFDYILRKEQKEATKAMHFGKALHLMTLEPEKFRKLYIEMPDFGDLRSSKNREMKAAWLLTVPSDAVILTAEELQNLVCMIESVMSHKVACGMLRDSFYERVGVFKEPSTGMKGKIKPDAVSNDCLALTDVKSCRDPGKYMFRRAMVEHRYDMQDVWYATGVKAITGIEPKYLNFIAVENKSPWDVCVYTMTDLTKHTAKAQIETALARIKTGVQTGKWPGRQPDGKSEGICLPEYIHNQAENGYSDEVPDFGNVE